MWDMMFRMADQDIASEVRAVIARQDANQNNLAKTVGLTASALSRRLRGHIPFSALELRKVAIALNVPVSTLYGETEETVGARGGDAE